MLFFESPREKPAQSAGAIIGHAVRIAVGCGDAVGRGCSSGAPHDHLGGGSHWTSWDDISGVFLLSRRHPDPRAGGVTTSIRCNWCDVACRRLEDTSRVDSVGSAYTLPPRPARKNVAAG